MAGVVVEAEDMGWFSRRDLSGDRRSDFAVAGGEYKLRGGRVPEHPQDHVSKKEAEG
jgi:hypothetical protein